MIICPKIKWSPMKFPVVEKHSKFYVKTDQGNTHLMSRSGQVGSSFPIKVGDEMVAVIRYEEYGFTHYAPLFVAAISDGIAECRQVCEKSA